VDSDIKAETHRLLKAYLDGSIELADLSKHIRPLMGQEGWGVSLDLLHLPPEQQERAGILVVHLEEWMLDRLVGGAE